MIGKRRRPQPTLFIPGSIEDFIPEDHILKRVDRVLDLGWLDDEVADSYCEDNGRPSIAPQAAARLMLAGFFQGIVHDRKLMREAQVNMAIRWFAGYALDEPLPDHSSLTRIRQRWGAERFKRIFDRTVGACIAAGLVGGETVHIDATLIRADVSWESLTAAHAEATIKANRIEDDNGAEPENDCNRPGRPRTREKQPKKRSITDPDATLTTSGKEFRMEPSYKQHTAVDDAAGVIVDVEVTTGEANEGARLMETLGRVEQNTGKPVERVTADAAYASAANYKALEERRTDAIIPPQKVPRAKKSLPASRFKCDALNERVRCPAGKTLTRRSRAGNGWAYRGDAGVCGACAMRADCMPATAKVRTVLIVDGHPALLRARRRFARGDPDTARWYARHRWKVEGVHGVAKTQHGLRRAVRRGIYNVAIQAYLTAAVINLKRLAALLPSLKGLLTPLLRSFGVGSSIHDSLGNCSYNLFARRRISLSTM